MDLAHGSQSDDFLPSASSLFNDDLYNLQGNGEHQMDIGGCLATFGIGHCAYGVHYGHLASGSLIGTIFFPPYYKR